MKQATCEERIDKELEDELQSLRNSREEWNNCGACYHEWFEDGVVECPECESDDISTEEGWLWYEQRMLESTLVHKKYRIGLSWGGPADGFYVYTDSENNVEHITYYFQDWFDGAEKELRGDDFDIALQVLESQIELLTHA